MKLLAIDTATEACSAALWLGGEVHEHYQLAPRQHAKLILPMVDQLLAGAALKPAQLDGLVFCRGPGSFTGVRIAAAAVQGIAIATDLPVVAVSSLAAIAHRCWREQQVTHCVSMIDARMQQLYWGCFETLAEGKTRDLSIERVSDPEALSEGVPSLPEHTTWAGAGSGLAAYRDKLAMADLIDANQGGVIYPSARDMLYLAQADFAAGKTLDAAAAVPIYLRDNVALTEQQRAELAKASPPSN